MTAPASVIERSFAYNHNHRTCRWYAQAPLGPFSSRAYRLIEYLSLACSALLPQMRLCTHRRPPCVKGAVTMRTTPPPSVRTGHLPLHRGGFPLRRDYVWNHRHSAGGLLCTTRACCFFCNTPFPYSFFAVSMLLPNTTKRSKIYSVTKLTIIVRANTRYSFQPTAGPVRTAVHHVDKGVNTR